MLHSEYDTAFKAFLKSSELGTAILANTQTKRLRDWAKGYSVILFSCGKYQVTDRESTPRLNRKNQVVVPISRLENEDWIGEDPLFSAALDVLHCNYAYAVKDTDLLLQYLTNMITRFNLLFANISGEDLAVLNIFLKQVPIVDRELAKKDTIDFLHFICTNQAIKVIKPFEIRDNSISAYAEMLEISTFRVPDRRSRKVKNARALIEFLATYSDHLAAGI